jgi:hypothetical protein
MTNEKFSMTNFQFRLNALVAACRTAPFAPPLGHSIWHKDGFTLGQNDPYKAPVWAEKQGQIGAVMSNPDQSESK